MRLYQPLGMTSRGNGDYPSDPSVLFVCLSCGAAVGNRIIHDEWHGDVPQEDSSE